MKETMTPRERWLAVLQRRKPDRVPMDYWGTEEATQKIMKHLGCSSADDMFKRLHIDKVFTVAPKYTGPDIPRGEDMFGCRYRDVDYGMGVYAECIHNPLSKFQSVEEIKQNYKWPSPDWWDYSVIPGQIKNRGDFPIRGGGSEPFLIYKDLRGQDQAFVDLIENPEIVHYCLDRLFGLAYERSRRIYEQIPGKIMFSYIAEDLGGQQGLMMSLKHIREFLLPRMKRMIDLSHSAGALAFHHDDGAIRSVLPELIEIGIDILNPIQWRCKGMEREGLKKDFGEKLIFHGGMDNQHTLPFGKAEEVRQEVLDNLRILGANGGYILAPCHNIQAVSPAENITAMYETGYENGWV